MPMPDLEKPDPKPSFDLDDLLEGNDLDWPPQKKKKTRKPKNKQGHKVNVIFVRYSILD